MRPILPTLAFVIFIGVHPAFGQSFWDKISESEILSAFFSKRQKPDSFNLFRLNDRAFRTLLTFTPKESFNKSNLLIDFPDKTGKLKQYRIVESSSMEPALAAAFPDIKSYSGEDVDDPGSNIRFAVSDLGLEGLSLSSTGKTTYFSTLERAHNIIMLTEKSQLGYDHNLFECLTPAYKNESSNKIGELRNANDGLLRTYRAAFCASGEFSSYWLNGTEANDTERKGKVLAAINNITTQVNAIFERDFGVRLLLVNNELNIIYLNSGTDPWSASTLNSKTQTTCDQQIGSSNYDIGHLLHAAANNGNAGCIGCVCINGSKGGGFTSYVDLASNYFVIDYLAHELGHQFGANHTFTFRNESTGAQMEPGSGSSIMGYAGITGATDVQPHSDPFFHAYSITQVTNYIIGSSGASCAVNSVTGNTAPTANAGNNYTIPKSTPFELTGTATDIDGGDVLTYLWDQLNLGTSVTTYPKANATSGPTFRSYPAVTSPKRLFPNLSNILDGSNGNTWEVLSSSNRALDFKFTVRDNHSGGGNTSSDATRITVSSASGPFLITSQNTATTWPGNSVQTVTWSVNSTTSSPVSCANVSIVLSENGGQSFPYVLIASTPNDGNQSITVPNISNNAVRIKVMAVGNVFCDINNAAITITSASTTCDAPSGLTVSNLFSTQAKLNWTAVAGASSYDVQYKLNSSSTWLNAALGLTTNTYTLTGLSPSSSYNWQVSTNCPSLKSNFVALSFSTPATEVCSAPVSLTTSSITATSAILSWAPVSGAGSYMVQYKTNASDTWITAAAATTGTSQTLTGLVSSTLFDWQVRTNCATLNSVFSGTQFSTLAPPPCAAPLGLVTSSITTSSAIIAWSAVGGAFNYTVHYRQNGASTWVETNTSGLSFSIAGLAASSLFDWEVRANCSSGMSAYSSMQFTTLGATPCLVPAASSTSNITSNAAALNWSAVSGAVSYKVEYKTAASGTWLVAIANTTAISYALISLASNTVYDWRVSTNCSSGSSATLAKQFTTLAAATCPGVYDISSNGNISGAGVIPLNTNIYGTIAIPTDIDYFKFVLTSTTQVNLTLTELPMNYHLGLYNISGSTISLSSNSGTSSESITRTLSAGTYHARVRSSNSSSQYHPTLCYNLKVTTPSNLKIVSEPVFNIVKIYPNPVKDQLVIQVPANLDAKSIRMTDIMGREMIRTAYESGKPVNVQGLNPGLYLINIFSVDGKLIKTEKLIKE